MSSSKNEIQKTPGSATKNFKLPFSMESIAKDIAAMNGVPYVPNKWVIAEKRKQNQCDSPSPSSSKPKRKLVRLNLEELRRELEGSVKSKPTSRTSTSNFQRRSTVSRKSSYSISPSKKRTSAVIKTSSTNNLNRPSIVTRSSMSNLQQKPAAAKRSSIATRSTLTNIQQKPTVTESVMVKRRKLDYDKNCAEKEPFLNGPVTRSAKGLSSPVPNSPLLNMEEVEDDLINNRKVITKNYKPFNENPVTSASKINTLATITEECDVEKKKNTSKESTPSSDREFEQLEKMCSNSLTPVTVISNLLKGTNIGSNKKRASKMSSLEAMLKEECDKHERIIKEESDEHERIIKKEKDKLERIMKEENQRHMLEIFSIIKSNDIQSKNLKENVPIKMISSPTTCNYKDLRKSTLKKNLETNQMCLSPQSKGMEYYNSVKQVCKFLHTPKSERAALMSPTTRNIALKVRNQCFMLTETPKITKY